MNFRNLMDRLSCSIKSKGNSVRMLWLVTFLFIFAAVLGLNVLTPYIADDLSYMFYFGLGYPRYIHNLQDLIGSQSNHYHMWGGRVVVHGIAQVLLRLDPFITSLLNTLMYLFFVSLIYKHIRGCRSEHSLILFIGLNLMIWFFIPSLGDTLLWVTGSANYLWGTTIILLFLLPYRLGWKIDKGTSFTIFFSLIMFLLGLIAGCTNENTAAGMLVMGILFILIWYRKYQKVHIALVVGLCGALIGYIFMLLAPGNSERASINISVLLLLKRFISSTYVLFTSYGWILVFLVVMSIRKHKRISFYLTSPSAIYVIGAISAIYAMLLSPQFPERAWFGIFIFLIMALGVLLFECRQKNIIKNILVTSCFIGFIGFVFSYFIAISDILMVKRITTEREVIAQTAIEKEDNKAYFVPIKMHSRYVHDEDDETNFLLSYYYNIYIEFKK